jgi:hypothetical protein
LYNWLAWIKELDLTHYLILALDPRLYHELQQQGL